MQNLCDQQNIPTSREASEQKMRRIINWLPSDNPYAGSMTTSDTIKEYLAARDAISAERDQLIARLREIDAALGTLGIRTASSFYAGRGHAMGPRTRNEMSLKEAVLKVIDGKALTKQEVMDGVLATGYQFSTDDPMNSLGVILYGRKPKFKRANKKFTL
jgi:hypothetical protein